MLGFHDKTQSIKILTRCIFGLKKTDAKDSGHERRAVGRSQYIMVVCTCAYYIRAKRFCQNWKNRLQRLLPHKIWFAHISFQDSLSNTRRKKGEKSLGSILAITLSEFMRLPILTLGTASITSENLNIPNGKEV